MFPSQTIELRPQLHLTASPALVAFASLLAMPGQELGEAVARELADNPVLVVDEVARSRTGGDWSLDVGAWDVAAAPGWRETLAAELRLELPAADASLAELVVGCLDERAFLSEEPGATARAAGLDSTRALNVLEILRTIAPAGVGARDPREAMLLQIARRPDGESHRALAMAIVGSQLDAIAEGRPGAAAQALGVTREEVVAAIAYLQAHTRPRPSVGSDGAATPWARPDLAFVERKDIPGRYRVVLLERYRLSVVVDPELRAAVRAMPDHRLRAMVDRADAFVGRLEERWATLGRVATVVAERQAGLLRDGNAAAVRLTRAEVAASLGIHESTVSRAVAGKYARLPSGRSVPFATFFDGATGVRAALMAILAAEPARVSDAELGRRLAAAGHVVARRTVAKYRGRLGIAAGGRATAKAASAQAKAASAQA